MNSLKTEKNDKIPESIPTIAELIKMTGMSIKGFSEYFEISYRTVQDWNSERRTCSVYIRKLMLYKLINEGLINQRD